MVSSKIPTELYPGFLPWNFLYLPGGFLEAFGTFCRLPYFWYYWLSAQEAQKASRKPPGSCNKIQSRNPGNIFVDILEETIIS